MKKEKYEAMLENRTKEREERKKKNEEVKEHQLQLMKDYHKKYTSKKPRYQEIEENYNSKTEISYLEK